MITTEQRIEFDRLCKLGQGKHLLDQSTELHVDGYSAIECWVLRRDGVKNPPCREPDLYDRARNGKIVDAFRSIEHELEPVTYVVRCDDADWIDQYLPRNKVAKRATLWDKLRRLWTRLLLRRK